MSDPATSSSGATGDPPDGTESNSATNQSAGSTPRTITTSLGESPTEVGGSPAPPLPAPHIPDHELLRPIGRGAYGEVWIARAVTGAFRAVKIVRRGSFDHDRPFEREFEGILKFEPVSRTHDSQVDILHVGRGEDYFYYVMELADDQATGGQINPDNYHPRTLKSDLLFHSRLSFEECVSIGIALTTALEHLHRNGLVHRDVKPSNTIFVNGVAKLADIGLVTGVDKTRSYVGTEGFVAPEGPGTPQADLFSLGKVLYEMATGKDRQEFPELPTNLRELPDREGLVELNAVIAKACRHDPRDRYLSAADMRAELELLRSGKSLARLHRAERRLRFVSRAGAVVTALGILILGGWIYQRFQTREARKLAESNRALAVEKSVLADENRQRVLQLDLANGIREMEAGDLGAAMLWFADGLNYATNDPAQAEMHRLRLSMLLQMHPKPLAIIPGSSRTNEVFDIRVKVSRDGERLLVTSDDRIELWELSFPPQQLGQIPIPEMWTNHALSHALSADGRRVVLVSATTAQLWTIKSSNDVQLTPLGTEGLRHPAFADEDRLILGLNSLQALVAFDAQSGRMVQEVARFESEADRLRVSHDGRRAAVMLTNHVVHAFDLARRRAISTFQLGERDVLAFVDANGRFAVSAPVSEGKPRAKYVAKIWELNTGRETGLPMEHADEIYNLHFGWNGSWNGRRLATAGRDRTARMWNQITGDALGPPLKHPSAVILVAFSPDNTRLATGDREGTIRVWEVESGRLLTPPLRHSGMCRAVTFAKNGAVLVGAGLDGLVRLWDLATEEVPQMALGTPRTASEIIFSPNGEFLVVSCKEVIFVWRVKDWNLLHTINHGSSDSTALKLAPDNNHFAVTAKGPKGVRVWSLQTGAAVSRSMQHGTNKVLDVSFSPDGRTLATGGEDNTVRLWDWRQAHQLGEPLRHAGRVLSVSVSPRGDRLLASTALSNDLVQLWLWDLDRRAVIAQGTPREARSLTPVFSPDGSKWLLPETYKGVRMMSASDGQPLSQIMWHDDTIVDMSFSPDGSRIITSSADQTARIWDSVSAQPVAPPLMHEGVVAQSRFAHAGRLIATRTDSGSLRLWDGISGLAMMPSVPRQGQMTMSVFSDGQMLATRTPDRRILLYDFRNALAGEDLANAIRWRTSATLKDGVVGKLARDELERLQEEMRIQQPQQFILSKERLVRWHERQIIEFGYVSQLEASLFHLDRLLEIQLDDALLQQRRAGLLAKRVPARDPAIPARLIDLTDYYTRSFNSITDGEFADLPRGVHRLAGMDFDLRGLVLLDHDEPLRLGMPGEFPRTSHIRVGQHCQRLHFLQGTKDDREIDGAEVSRFVIHFADGSRALQPMISGRHVRDLHSGSKSKPADAVVAWEGHQSIGGYQVSVERLYKTTWVNPRPQLEITHLEYHMGEQKIRPFLVAITAE